MTNLIERIEAGERSNELDVLIEVALFEPGSVYAAIRANNAGTKVIYTDVYGNDVTCWAWDWSRDPSDTLAALRARDVELQEPSPKVGT